jgi:hypothetical protein
MRNSPWDRAHRWQNGRCSLCAMLSTWEGARHSCTGVDVVTSKKAQREREKAEKRRRPTRSAADDVGARR